MKRTTYTVHAEKNGKRVISIHKIHDNLPAAKQDAATLAGMVPGAKGIVVRNPGTMRAVKRNTARTVRRNPSDFETALKVAAIISRNAGNKRGPIPKAGDPASIVRWLKWNDRDGDYRFLKYATDEEAADQLVYTLINDDTEDWLKKGAARNPANPPREVVLGHVVVHTKQGYTIPAYKKVFAEMKEVRKWLKAHVAREREAEAKANPACRCKTKNNPKCRCKR